NLAASMGLQLKQTANKYPNRTWFNVLRRNWDFVPFNQICTLLDLPEDEIRELMFPYNFVHNHLGPKPPCPMVGIEQPVADRPKVISHFRYPMRHHPVKEERFKFLEHLKRPLPEPPWGKAEGETALTPCMLFPYSATFGDALGKPDFDSFYPSGVLKNVARLGLDSIWVHGVLNELLPSRIFPEFGKKGELRIRNLNKLIGQARQHGLGVYMFLNEPRGLFDDFFEKYPHIKGAKGRRENAPYSMCTSTQMVKDFLVESMNTLFEKAPGLEGIILITASEAPTNCYAKHRKTPCPRCAKRSGPEVVAEVCQLIEKGVHQVKPEAKVIIWDWSWMIVEDDPQKEIINQLPDNVTLIVDFERGTKIKRWGVENVVNEYCLSVTGPSPRAMDHARLARARNMPVMAKIQVGNTWELGMLPYIPVPSLVARKFKAVLDAGISGVIESWSLGTYPSPNWEVAQAFYKKPAPEIDTVLRKVAVGLYGKTAAPKVLQAWSIFADTFEQYPFDNRLVYSSFVQFGPANMMFFEPSKRKPRIFKNYDTLHWSKTYGLQTLADAFGQMAVDWRKGLQKLDEALTDVPKNKKRQAARDAAICRAVYIYFQSISNQARFLMWRDQYQQQPELLMKMRDLVNKEIYLSIQLRDITRADSRVGYEPAMQYLYLPLDIRERIVSCRYMLEKQIPEVAKKAGL
ncbi:MAG: hypothetical protein ACYTBZ_18180, partial [Planctomycetota bacterium]